jgi:hypothetical protein
MALLGFVARGAGERFEAHRVRRGHYEIAVDEPANLRVAAAFTELALVI